MTRRKRTHEKGKILTGKGTVFSNRLQSNARGWDVTECADSDGHTWLVTNSTALRSDIATAKGRVDDQKVFDMRAVIKDLNLHSAHFVGYVRLWNNKEYAVLGDRIPGRFMTFDADLWRVINKEHDLWWSAELTDDGKYKIMASAVGMTADVNNGQDVVLLMACVFEDAPEDQHALVIEAINAQCAKFRFCKPEERPALDSEPFYVLPADVKDLTPQV